VSNRRRVSKWTAVHLFPLSAKKNGPRMDADAHGLTIPTAAGCRPYCRVSAQSCVAGVKIAPLFPALRIRASWVYFCAAEFVPEGSFGVRGAASEAFRGRDFAMALDVETIAQGMTGEGECDRGERLPQDWSRRIELRFLW
jgi:hypothetical protein